MSKLLWVWNKTFQNVLYIYIYLNEFWNLRPPSDGVEIRQNNGLVCDSGMGSTIYLVCLW